MWMNGTDANTNTEIDLNITCLIYEMCKLVIENKEEKTWIVLELEIRREMSISEIIAKMNRLFRKRSR